ncbi:MAG: hypothetical protein ACRDTJ_23855, partial [Pseudonocardiaceae bacterium]
MASGEELHRRGVVELTLGNFAEAQGLLEQVRALAMSEGDAALQARADSTLAYMAADESDLDNALGLLEQALDVGGSDTEIRGLMLQQRATLLRRAGRPTEALATFGDAIDALVTRHRDLAIAYVNRGTVYLDQHNVEAAVMDFSAAAANFRAEGDEVAAAMADHNRGYALFIGGDLVGALEVMAGCYEVQAAAGPLLKAVCDADRAEVLMAAGLTGQGGAMLRQAAEAYGSKGQRQRQGEAELVLASHLVATDPTEAEQVARSALGWFEEAKAPGLALRARAVAFEAAVTAGGAPSDDGEELAVPLEEQGLS